MHGGCSIGQLSSIRILRARMPASPIVAPFFTCYGTVSNANLEAADTSSQRALELDPTSAEAHTSRGVALNLRQDHATARREFETALKLDPKLFEAHYFYARACLTEGKFEEAIIHYRNAWQARPEDYQAILLSSDALAKLGRDDEVLEAARLGIKLADAHLELNPDDARAWYLSGGALMRLGKVDEALERTRRAYAIDPEDAAVLFKTLAAIMLWRGSLTKRSITWKNQSGTGSASAVGWRMIRPSIRYATIRGSKLCCESFNANGRRP